ncbi:MAG TPA: GGDEF domain-containing protein [Candidatus Xenobia bacterium]
MNFIRPGLDSQRATGAQPFMAPSAAAPLATPELETLLLGGAAQTGSLQLLKPFRALARTATGSVESASRDGFGKAALIAAGVAAGVGVGAILGGPIGLMMAGLASAMGFMSGFVSLQSENKKLKEEVESLRYQATTDPLTGLANRGAIFDRLERDMRRTLVDGKTLGVILCDIDFFKKVNDTYGHAAGDTVLVEVARRMRDNVRPGDAVGRYGGEEILVVLPDCDARSLVEVAERLRAAIAAFPVPSTVGAVPVTMSLGCAVTERMKETGVGVLVAAADEALYRAKHGGRNRVECAFRL